MHCVAHGTQEQWVDTPSTAGLSALAPTHSFAWISETPGFGRFHHHHVFHIEQSLARMVTVQMAARSGLLWWFVSGLSILVLQVLEWVGFGKQDTNIRLLLWQGTLGEVPHGHGQHWRHRRRCHYLCT